MPKTPQETIRLQIVDCLAQLEIPSVADNAITQYNDGLITFGEMLVKIGLALDSAGER